MNESLDVSRCRAVTLCLCTISFTCTLCCLLLFWLISFVISFMTATMIHVLVFRSTTFVGPDHFTSHLASSETPWRTTRVFFSSRSLRQGHCVSNIFHAQTCCTLARVTLYCCTSHRSRHCRFVCRAPVDQVHEQYECVSLLPPWPRC